MRLYYYLKVQIQNRFAIINENKHVTKVFPKVINVINNEIKFECCFKKMCPFKVCG